MVIEEALEDYAKGFLHCDKIICHDCISDHALKDFIKAKGKKKSCSFCGQIRKCVTFDDFMEQIMRGIRSAYTYAIDELPIENGEYCGQTYTSEELVREKIYDQIGPNSDDVIDSIVNVMLDNTWCDVGFFSDTSEELAYYNWESFCRLVKERVRYVFYQTPSSTLCQNPAAILDTIASCVEKAKLTKRIDKNTKMYRCRTHEDECWYEKIDDFAPPPVEYAHAGRMNAEGINVLYLTLDPKTALMETNVTGKDYASIASFRIDASVDVLDLTKITAMEIPSIFDEKNRDLTSTIRFLRLFGESISQPAKIQGIDYVPTQIVTEYFRFVERPNQKKYKGILYNSVQNPGGKCLALFLTREEVLNKELGIHIIPYQTEHYKKEYKKQPSGTEAVEQLLASYGEIKIKDLPAIDPQKRGAIERLISKIGKT